MSACPTCGATYENSVKICPKDGSVLEATVEIDARVGQTLDGKYRLDSQLGAGGMGAIYKATHLMLDKQVAVKLIKPELVTSPDLVRRFQREARAAGNLSHPNIAAAYDLGQTQDGTLYIAMELVNGPSLKDVIRTMGPMPVDRAIRIMRQVGSALALAHRHNIIHRDLKPHNIMLATDGQGHEVAKLLDFGIAKTFDEASTQLTQTGFVLGTPQYMSPEQAAGRPIDGRSDLYSLGIILYEMLIGEVPFNDPSTPAVLVKHLTEIPAPPSIRRPDVHVSPELEAIALRCLEKDPAARFQSADEFLAALPAETGSDTATARVVPVPAMSDRTVVLPPPGSAGAATELAETLPPASAAARMSDATVVTPPPGPPAQDSAAAAVTLPPAAPRPSTPASAPVPPAPASVAAASPRPPAPSVPVAAAPRAAASSSSSGGSRPLRDIILLVVLLLLVVGGVAYAAMRMGIFGGRAADSETAATLTDMPAVDTSSPSASEAMTGAVAAPAPEPSAPVSMETPPAPAASAAVPDSRPATSAAPGGPGHAPGLDGVSRHAAQHRPGRAGGGSATRRRSHRLLPLHWCAGCVRVAPQRDDRRAQPPLVAPGWQPGNRRSGRHGRRDARRRKFGTTVRLHHGHSYLFRRVRRHGEGRRCGAHAGRRHAELRRRRGPGASPGTEPNHDPVGRRQRAGLLALAVRRQLTGPNLHPFPDLHRNREAGSLHASRSTGVSGTVDDCVVCGPPDFLLSSRAHDRSKAVRPPLHAVALQREPSHDAVQPKG